MSRAVIRYICLAQALVCFYMANSL
jgi:hypothetical protein